MYVFSIVPMVLELWFAPLFCGRLSTLARCLGGNQRSDLIWLQVFMNIVLDEAFEEKTGGEKVAIGMVVCDVSQFLLLGATFFEIAGRR